MRIFKRRGQAALEFMMTYGWAILVVLAAIGALSYFGILNPSKFTPDTCLASSGFACPGKPLVNSSTVTFSIVNGLGYSVNLSQTGTSYSTTLTTACSGAGIVYFCPQGDIACTNPSSVIEDGGGITVRLTNCPGLVDLNVVKGEFRFNYLNPQSKLTETLIVSVTGKSKTG